MSENPLDLIPAPDISRLHLPPHPAAVGEAAKPILQYCVQCYWQTGQLPTWEAISEELNIKYEFVQECFKSEVFLNSLRESGIDLDLPQKYNTVTLLTPIQLACADMVLNTLDRRSMRQKLEEVNVSTQRFQAWMRQPQFQSYLKARAQKLFEHTDPIAYTELIKGVEAGDYNFLKLFMEMRGHYTPKQEVSINIEVVMTKILEILAIELSGNPQLLERIATRLEEIEM